MFQSQKTNEQVFRFSKHFHRLAGGLALKGFLFPTTTYMLFTGREVRIGKNGARGLEYPRPRAPFSPIRTDLGR